METEKLLKPSEQTSQQKTFSSQRSKKLFANQTFARIIAAGAVATAAFAGPNPFQPHEEARSQNPAVTQSTERINILTKESEQTLSDNTKQQAEHQANMAAQQKRILDKKRKETEQRRKEEQSKQNDEEEKRAKPVAGMSQNQMDNAEIIVETIEKRNMPDKAETIALATALQESTLLNYANRNVPKSMQIPHEAVGEDNASVGLFQQQVGYDGSDAFGWGDVEETMDPIKSTKAFLKGLEKINGWEKMPVTVAAQKVQKSAFPSAYADDEKTAKKITAAIKTA
jgi:hypothetical protein